MTAVGIQIPPWATVTDVMRWRCVEALLEHPQPPVGLAQAYSRLRRAQRAETKAKTATHVAKFADETRSASTSRQPAGMTPEEVLRGLHERRAA